MDRAANPVVGDYLGGGVRPLRTWSCAVCGEPAPAGRDAPAAWHGQQVAGRIAATTARCPPGSCRSKPGGCVRRAGSVLTGVQHVDPVEPQVCESNTHRRRHSGRDRPFHFEPEQSTPANDEQVQLGAGVRAPEICVLVPASWSKPQTRGSTHWAGYMAYDTIDALPGKWCSNTASSFSRWWCRRTSMSEVPCPQARL